MNYCSKNQNKRVLSCPTQDVGHDEWRSSTSWTKPNIIDFDKKSRSILKKKIEFFEDYTLKEMVENPLDDLHEPMRSSLHSFLVNLYFYEKFTIKEDRIIDPLIILKSSIYDGPEYASFIDDLRSYALARKTRKKFIDHTVIEYASFSRLIDLIPDEKFCVGLLYRPDQLFPWRPQEINLKEFTESEIVQDSDLLKSFRKEVKKLLSEIPDDLREPTLGSIIRDTTASCAEGVTWKVPHSDPAVERDLSILKHVPASLKKSRAACIETYSSALRVRWIENSVRRINLEFKQTGIKYKTDDLEKIINSKISRTQRTVENYHVLPKRRKFENARTSYCRDFIKEGLTKPRSILRILLEEIQVKFPKWESIETGFFDIWKLQIEDEIFYPKRGHGLGMANELTTLMQIVIERLNISYGAPKPFWSAYLNDDAAAIFHCWDEAERYSRIDRGICKGLGLMVKEEASFLCIGYAVFCEVHSSAYIKNINNKDIFEAQSFGNLLKLTNASQLMNELRSLDVFPPKEILEEVLTFYPKINMNFWEVPEIIGGMKRCRLFGIDCSGVNRGGKLTFYEEVLYRMNKEKISFVPWRKTKRVCKALLFYDRELLELFSQNIFLDENIMFRSSVNPRDLKEYWVRYEKRLTQIMRSKRKKFDWHEVLDQIEKDNPEKDFLLNREEGELDVLYEFCTKYEYRNPFMYSMNEFIPKYNQNKRYVIINDKGFSFLLTEKGRRAESIKFRTRDYSEEPVFYRCVWMPNQVMASFFHDPYTICMAARALKVKPDLKQISDSKRELISLREKEYPDLKIEDWIWLGRIPGQLRWIYPKLGKNDLMLISKNKKLMKYASYLREDDKVRTSSFLEELRKFLPNLEIEKEEEIYPVPEEQKVSIIPKESDTGDKEYTLEEFNEASEEAFNAAFSSEEEEYTSSEEIGGGEDCYIFDD